MTRKFMSILRTISFMLAAVMTGFSAYAQGTYSVKLKLVDAKTGEPVAFATASLTAKGAKSASKYVLTDDGGAATITKVAKGTYALKAEIMGYKPHLQEITVDKSLNLGDIKMTEDVELLDAASVSAVGNPIIVKKDTVEYNASSFKTSDNDMLEELLKKLPGIEVGTDGSITANGETIKKITIDGKTFFLDDPQLASKNIPAKMIEKVKVVEKKSDQAMFTGIDDGEEETVIDLSMRPGMMRGWFGNVMVGGGHDIPSPSNDMNDWRYQGAAMVGRFTDKNQISLILNGNNTNNRGFNDVAGSMMQNMRGSRGMGRGTGGWRNNNGITTSWMAGLNGAFTLLDGNMDLSGNYLYNGSDKYIEEESSKTTYMDDGSRLIYGSKGENVTRSQGHRIGVRLDHKFSENTSILFEPQFNFGSGNFTERSDFATLSEMDGQRDSTNKGFNYNSGDNRNWTASGFLLFRQKLGKKGRTISANVRYSFSNNELSGLNQSMTRIWDESAAAWGADPERVNQMYDQTSNSSSLRGRIVYTEPLARNFFLEANYEYSWNRNKSVKTTYDSSFTPVDFGGGWSDFTEKGMTRNDNYSNDILNRYINQRAGVSFSYQKKKFRAQLGATVNPTNTHNETNGKTYDSKVINWSPQAMIRYSVGENINLRFFYNGRSAQPSTSQLMPVLDNSDPQNLSLGNPYLEPYFSHNFRGMFGYTNKKKFTSVHARFGGGIVQNAITSAQWYDASGVQYSLPVNGKTTGSVNARVMVNSPLGKSGFSIFSMTYANYSETTSYIGKSSFRNEAGKYYDSDNAEFKYEQFNSDFPTLDKLREQFTENRTQTVNFTQHLRFTYRNDFVELIAGGRTRMAKSWYTITSSNQQITWNNQATGSMNWTIPGGINLIAELNYNWYNGYTTPQEDEFVLNAEITKLLLKKKLTIGLKAYDILAQSKNLSVTDASNYHLETRNNTLGRYIILSLTYRFGNQKNNQQRRGPGMGGPMGPPPGR